MNFRIIIFINYVFLYSPSILLEQYKSIEFKKDNSGTVWFKGNYYTLLEFFNIYFTFNKIYIWNNPEYKKWEPPRPYNEGIEKVIKSIYYGESNIIDGLEYLNSQILTNINLFNIKNLDKIETELPLLDTNLSKGIPLNQLTEFYTK